MEFNLDRFSSRLIDILNVNSVAWWAKQLNVNKSTIFSRWLKGMPPKTGLIAEICRLSDTSPNWLLFEVGPQRLSEAMSSPTVPAGSRIAEDPLFQLIKMAIRDDTGEIDEALRNEIIGTIITYFKRERAAIEARLQKAGAKPQFEAFQLQYDPQGALIFANEAIRNRLNLEENEIIGTQFKLPIYEADRHRFAQAIRSVTPEAPRTQLRARMVFEERDMPTWTEWEITADAAPNGELRHVNLSGEIVPKERLRAERRPGD